MRERSVVAVDKTSGRVCFAKRGHEKFVSGVLLLRRRLLVHQHVARIDYSGWIDGHVSFVDVLDNSFFIDHEGGAITEALLFVEHAVVLDDGAFEIAEQRKRNAELFGEFAIGGNAVYTESKNLRIGGVEFGNISLICF